MTSCVVTEIQLKDWMLSLSWMIALQTPKLDASALWQALDLKWLSFSGGHHGHNPSEGPITLVGISITVKTDFFKILIQCLLRTSQSCPRSHSLFLVVSAFQRLCPTSCPGRQMVLHSPLDVLSQTIKACAFEEHGMYVWRVRDSSINIPLMENLQ